MCTGGAAGSGGARTGDAGDGRCATKRGRTGDGGARVVDADDGLSETKTPRTRGNRNKESKHRKGEKFSKIMQTTKVSRKNKRVSKKNKTSEND